MKTLNEKHRQYITDFTITAFRLAAHSAIQTRDVAMALGIYPFMLLRWKKRVREDL